MKHTLLLASISILFAACSSGGGGSGVAQTPDGTKINLDVSDKGVVGGKTDNGTLIGHNYTHVFYGVWTDDSNQVRELRYQGTETPRNEIPTSGSATYYGNAVRLDSLTGTTITDATSRVNVNFSNKTVDGEITMPGLIRNITLHQGRLNGAEYSGQASVLGNSGGQYQGSLFGKNAAETAGIVRFDNNSNLDTVFGGKRY